MARFSSIVMSGAVPASGSWNTRPMWAARRKSGSRVTSSPSTVTVPVSGGSLPAMTLSIVDFPAPLEPMTVANSPGSSRSEMPWRASRSFGVPAKNVLLTSVSSSMSRTSRRGGRRRGAAQGPQRTDPPEHAPLGQEERDDDEDGGDELHVVGVEEPDPQGELDGDPVQHGAEHDGERGDEDDTRAEDRLAEDDRGQAGDDEPDPHRDVGEPLVLGDDRPAQADQPVGQRQPEDLRPVGVDAEAADHLLV